MSEFEGSAEEWMECEATGGWVVRFLIVEWRSFLVWLVETKE